MNINQSWTLKELPVCQKCRKPVDYLIETEDFDLQCLVYTVTCHGETQRVELPMSLFVIFNPIIIEMRFAFQNREIA